MKNTEIESLQQQDQCASQQRSDQCASQQRSDQCASQHWSRQKEKAAGYWLVKFTLVLFRIFPVIILRLLAFPVGFFYFVFSQKSRAVSKLFLDRAAPFVSNVKTARKCQSPFAPLRHIVSFSLTLVEKFESWGGKFPFKDIKFQDDGIGELIVDLEKGNGVFLFTSHLGNTELLRGLAGSGKTGVSRKIPMTAIVDMQVSGNFSRVIRELNPQYAFDILAPGEIGPGAAMLEEKLISGGIVTIAGDRTSAEAGEKIITLPFLGKDAPFSLGAFYLAALMKAPVYFVFALRRKDLSLKPEYNMHVHKFPLSPADGRKERFRQSSAMAGAFASLLESHLKEQPFQWYNFFDFWSK